MNANDGPLFSIVTINYNNKPGLESTIKSVLDQENKDFEYIIIDGGSDDGSKQVILSQQEEFTYWVSERDRGIYDAMNKGAKVAKGAWIIFLNSGDYFASETVLEKTSIQFRQNEVDFLYGDSIKLFESGEQKEHPAGKPQEIWKGGQIRHNALFCRTTLVQKFPFDLDKRLSVVADFDFIYHMFAMGKLFHKMDFTVLKYEVEGVSNQRSRIRGINDIFYVQRRYRHLRKVSYGYLLKRIFKVMRFKYLSPIKNRINKVINVPR